jgi:hypothetical protein
MLDMEDAHTHLLSLPGDTEACYFGVFDGHGGMSIQRLNLFNYQIILCSGARVAQYSGSNLHKHIVSQPAYSKLILTKELLRWSPNSSWADFCVPLPPTRVGRQSRHDLKDQAVSIVNFLQNENGAFWLYIITSLSFCSLFFILDDGRIQDAIKHGFLALDEDMLNSKSAFICGLIVIVVF